MNLGGRGGVGTFRGTDYQLRVAGGRVVNVTGIAPTIADARARAYEAIDLLHFDGMRFRTDIAARAV